MAISLAHAHSQHGMLNLHAVCLYSSLSDSIALNLTIVLTIGIARSPGRKSEVIGSFQL